MSASIGPTDGGAALRSRLRFVWRRAVRWFDSRRTHEERKLLRVSKQVSAAKRPQTRQELLDEVAMAVGAFRTATDIVDEAVASAFAVNRTDLRLIEALQVAGQLTAGELASTVGLSPSATTTA